MIANSGKESVFNEGDKVEITTGDYNLMCGDRTYSWYTPGTFTVEVVEYEMGEFTYTLIDHNGHRVHNVLENDLKQVQ